MVRHGPQGTILNGSRMRRYAGRLLLGLAVVLLPIGLIANWARSTLYESSSFSNRAVELLDDPTVRRELAARLTEQLARSGNKQAVDFRPAFQVAVEAVVDTDTFRSIFRTAVYQVHKSLLSSNPNGASLDLSDSVDIIVSNLQLPATASKGQSFNGSLGNSLADTTHRLAKLRIWSLDDIAGNLAGGGLLGAVVLGAASVALAEDRRRGVRRVGWGIVAGGLLTAAVVQLAVFLVRRSISDPRLSDAVGAGLSGALRDLLTTGLWVAGYGAVVAAAASTDAGHRFDPSAMVAAVRRWVERRRATTRGTVGLGVAGIFVGLLVVTEVDFWLRTMVVGLGLLLTYAGTTELLSLAQRVVAPTSRTRTYRRRRLAVLATSFVVLTGLMAAGLVVFTERTATRAEAAGKPECNGAQSLCDLPLNLAMFPGSHNSMSSALYPGFLFAEQIGTIGDQLDAGVRALFIDTHYGVPSSAQLPGSRTPIVITDRAAELKAPPGDDIDPAIAARAEELSKQAPPAAGAKRGIYLCHNYCELGAVPFEEALGEVRSFLDEHPNEVLMLVIQDATTPADTAAAIRRSGLDQRAYTLHPGEQIPTLGDLIQSRHNLLVLAEKGGPGAPAWYGSAYQWFQETPYSFADAKAFTCAPNRGPSDAPLFLVNHWVADSPPDPAAAAKVNSRAALTKRIEQCAKQRGLIPNVVAVDFAEKSAVVKTVAALNRTLLSDLRGIKRSGTRGSEQAAPPPPPRGGAPDAEPGVSLLSQPTPITTLTGGDPGVFCATVGSTLSPIVTWALSSIGAPPGQVLRPDLTMAPLVARQVQAALPSAPAEVKAHLALVEQRSAQGVAALQALGLTDAQIGELADTAAKDLAARDPDDQAVEQHVADVLTRMVGKAELAAAVRRFGDEHPRPEGLFDLGEVSPALATSSGFTCLAG